MDVTSFCPEAQTQSRGHTRAGDLLPADPGAGFTFRCVCHLLDWLCCGAGHLPGLITIAHLRMTKETGASKLVLVLALIGTSRSHPVILLVHAAYIPANFCDPGRDDHPGLGSGGSLEMV